MQIPPRSFKHRICSCILKHDTNARVDVKDVSNMGVLEIIRSANQHFYRRNSDLMTKIDMDGSDVIYIFKVSSDNQST